MMKIKCNCQVAYARNPDVPQKALSERSHFLCYWREPEITQLQINTKRLVKDGAVKNYW